jgi:hypothetical protein
MVHYGVTVSGIAYLVIAAVMLLGSTAFKKDSPALHPHKRSFRIVLLSLVAGIFLKFFFVDRVGIGPNYYKILGTHRFATSAEIKKAYKTSALKYHPDKNTMGSKHEIMENDRMFDKVKEVHDILNNEKQKQRDIYNIFGDNPEHLKFDPREDRVALISTIIIQYILWSIAAMVFTYPQHSCGSRSTIFGILVLMATLELSISLNEDSEKYILPQWLLRLSTFTEYEFMVGMHSLLPFIIVMLRVYAEQKYVDLYGLTHSKLTKFLEIDKSISVVMQDSMDVLRASQTISSFTTVLDNLDEKVDKTLGLLSDFDTDAEDILDFIEENRDMKNWYSRPYWLYFVGLALISLWIGIY